VGLTPDGPRGGSRKGLAHFNLDDLDEASKAYEAGLKLEPGNEGMKEALAQVQNKKAASGLNMLQNLLRDPMLTAKLRANPQPTAYCEDPAFMALLERAAYDPNGFQDAMKDQRITEVIMMQLGQMGGMGGMGGENPFAPTETAPPPKPKAEPKPEPKKEEPKPEVPENVKEAEALKEQGNAAYKAKKFDEALKFYADAREKDPSKLISSS
jgi:stress-induced-phosphoprotein 1